MKKFFKKLAYTLVLTGLLTYGVYTLYEQEIELNNIKGESLEYSNLLESEKIKYEQLLETKDSINQDSYIEEVAREKLGLVMPYEIIFVDASI